MPNIDQIIAKRRESGHPVLSSNWYVVFPDLHVLPPDAISNQFIDTLLSGKDLSGINISARVKSVSIPSSTVEFEKAPSVNTYWYYASRNDLSELTVELYEFEDGKTTEYIQTWHDLITNPDGTYNPPVCYKRDMKVLWMNTQKKEIVVFDLIGFAPSTIGDVSQDYETSDLVSVSVTLTGDSVHRRVIQAGLDGVDFVEIEKSWRKKAIGRVMDLIGL